MFDAIKSIDACHLPTHIYIYIYMALDCLLEMLGNTPFYVKHKRHT